MTFDDILAGYQSCYTLGLSECLLNTDITTLVTMGIIATPFTVLALVAVSVIGELLDPGNWAAPVQK